MSATTADLIAALAATRDADQKRREGELLCGAR